MKIDRSKKVSLERKTRDEGMSSSPAASSPRKRKSLEDTVKVQDHEEENY